MTDWNFTRIVKVSDKRLRPGLLGAIGTPQFWITLGLILLSILVFINEYGVEIAARIVHGLLFSNW